MLCKRIFVDSFASFLPQHIVESPAELKGYQTGIGARIHQISYEFPMTVYFCGSCVISKQQTNYSGCIPREKSFLNCFAHSLLALNYHKLRDWCVAGLEKSQPPAWGLSYPGFSARTGMVIFTALLAPSGSCCTKWGLSAKVCCCQLEPC